MEDLRIKISVLWLFWTVAFLVSLVSVLFEPGAMARINAGEMAGFQVTSELILLTTIMMLVPLVMAFSILDFEGFDKSLGKCVSGSGLHWYLPF